MSTLAQIRARIADRLVRTDLNSQIDEAINAAIEYYEQYRFWFNEKTGTFSTVAGQKAYGSADSIPTDIREIDSLKITISSNNFVYPEKKPYQLLEEIDSSSFRSQPCYYAYYQEKFYFYPLPSAVYTVTVSYQQSYSEMTLDADTNDFTAYARKLIENHALMLIYSDVLQHPENVMAQEKRVSQELQSLIIRSSKLSASNTLVATSW